MFMLKFVKCLKLSLRVFLLLKDWEIIEDSLLIWVFMGTDSDDTFSVKIYFKRVQTCHKHIHPQIILIPIQQVWFRDVFLDDNIFPPLYLFLLPKNFDTTPTCALWRFLDPKWVLRHGLPYLPELLKVQWTVYDISLCHEIIFIIPMLLLLLSYMPIKIIFSPDLLAPPKMIDFLKWHQFPQSNKERQIQSEKDDFNSEIFTLISSLFCQNMHSICKHLQVWF